MALWLFRRKSRRKRSRAGSPARGDVGALPRNFTAPSTTAAAGPIASSPIRRRPSSRRQRTEPNKLQRRMRTYSFESGRADNLEIGSAGAWKTKPPNPSPPDAKAPANSALDDSTNAYASGEPIPTLHHSSSKRDGRHLLSRAKSSKRRKNAHDREREAEIKAMSTQSMLIHSHDFTPVRPAAEHWTAGRPMKRETIKAPPSTLAARYARERGKQPSDVSLPLAESIDSAMSSDSEPVAYTISPFAAFAPKPTLRYTSRPPNLPPSSSFPSRHTSQKRRLELPIPEATLKAHKHVDELADDMDASDLRELMERDARRRARRRAHDEERAARRLAREAERQHQDQQQRQQEQQPSGQASGSGRPGASDSPTSADMARGVRGREAVGLGVATTSAPMMTSAVRRRSSSASTQPRQNSIELEAPPHRGIDDLFPEPLARYSVSASVAGPDEDVEMSGTNERLAKGSGSPAGSTSRASPVDMFHQPASVPVAPAELDLLPVVPHAEEATTARELASIPARTPSKLRKLAHLRKRLSNASSLWEDRDSSKKTSSSIARKPSNSGSSRRRGSLSWGALGTLFRWTARSKRAPGSPTFSNLSRDSMAARASIQRSQQQFESQSSQLRNIPQTLVEEPGPVAAEDAAAGMARLAASSAFVTSSARGTNFPPRAHPLKAMGGAPKRTLSRFREDLPGLLMTPPSSRLQSPEAENQPPLPAQPIVAHPAVPYHTDPNTPVSNANGIHEADDDDESIILAPAGSHTQGQLSSYDSNSMGNSMTNGTRDDTPTSWLQMDETEPSPEPQQSLSLASIDSEGSWLSGRTASRRRLKPKQPSLDIVTRSLHQKKSSQYPLSPTESVLASTANATIPASGAAPADDESSTVMDDEYLSRLARSSRSGGSHKDLQRESMGDMLPSSDDELHTVNGDADARWGSVNEKRVQATHPVNLVRSREGLMTMFYNGEEGSDRDESPASATSTVSRTSPVSPNSSDFKEMEAGVQRARSVNLGRGHVRHISAGSVKVLDIMSSQRNSVDMKAPESGESLF